MVASNPTEEKPPTANWRAATLAPFQFRIFFAIWVASLASNLGGIIQSVGASWLMTSLAPSADMVALVQAANTAPIMLFSLVGGALADTFDRRTVMLTAQLLMAAISTTLAVLAFQGAISPWMLLGFTFLIGSGTALYGPSWQSSVGELVPRDHIAQAVTLNSLGFNMARSVGPAIGGALVALGGAPFAFAINATSYIALITVLFRWRRDGAGKSNLPPEPLVRAINTGARYVSLSPAIINVLVRGGLYGFCGAALWALMPLVARDVLKSGALMYGTLFGVFGIGAMAGALISARVRAQMSSNRLVNVMSVVFAAATAIAGLSPWPVLTFPAMFFAGASWVLSLSTFNVCVQLSAPRWVVGRAISFYQMATFGGLAIGSAFWGVTARHAGVTEALCLGALAMLATLLTAKRMALPGGELIDFNPQEAPAYAPPAIEISPRSGPIVLTIEYRVDQSKANEFVEAMMEISRIRRRDGARRWTLMQDIDDPEIWTERYHSPTWIEHLRRRSRMTVADDAARARALSFHKGPERPVVRRLLERPPGASPMADIHPHRNEPVHDTTLEH